MMFYGLTAFVNGAIAALVVLLPATILFWRATAPMRGGVRALRSAVITIASYGAMLLATAGYGHVFERVEYRDETIMGGAVGGGILAALLFLVLLLALPRAAPEGTP